MIECLIIGDSIAKGMSLFQRECVSHSIVGINSFQWNKRFVKVDLEAATVIISLGTNDKGINTLDQLNQLRLRVKSNNVVWVLPPCNQTFCNSDANYSVAAIALINDDLIIKTDKLSVDKIHPSGNGYKDLVEQARATMKPVVSVPMWPAEKFGQTNLGPPTDVRK